MVHKNFLYRFAINIWVGKFYTTYCSFFLSKMAHISIGKHCEFCIKLFDFNFAWTCYQQLDVTLKHERWCKCAHFETKIKTIANKLQWFCSERIYIFNGSTICGRLMSSHQAKLLTSTFASNISVAIVFFLKNGCSCSRRIFLPIILWTLA